MEAYSEVKKDDPPTKISSKILFPLLARAREARKPSAVRISVFSVVAETSREGDVGGDLKVRIRF